MSTATALVLMVAALATATLLWYARVWLPRRLEDRISDSAKAFGTAVELRFPSHQGLMDRVTALSSALGRMLGLDRSQLKNLEMASRLRDIGLCAVPYALVNSMRPSEWNIAELEMYLHHATVGATTLERIPELRHLAEIVRHHHSRYDDGKAFSLNGEHLPVESRILRVVTDYVWIERNEGRAAARMKLAEGRGTHYWPAAVDGLRAVLVSTYVEDREPALV